MISTRLWALRLRFTRRPDKIAALHRESGVKMGPGCTIFRGASFGSEPYLVRLGRDVRITSSVQFITHDGGMHVLRGRKGFERADSFGPILLGNNVFVGLRSIIMPNVRIGDNVVIGAGSVVTNDIPSNCVAAGVPCRVLRTIDEYAVKSADNLNHTKGMSPPEKRRILLSKFSALLE